MNSANLPLSIANAVISIDLTAFSDTTAMNTAITTALSNYVTSTALTNALSAYTDTTSLSTLLTAKQDALTASAGIFLTGSTISSYTLRWNATSIPTAPSAIQELHWDGYTMAETVNIGTGKVELTIGHPTGMATHTWASAQLHPIMPAVSQGLGIPLLAPTHMPPLAGGQGTWTDNGSDATISVGQTPPVGQEHWNVYSCPANSSITFTMEVKLNGTATNIVLLFWTHMSTVQVFDASNGLNTSTFTQVSCTYPNNTASAVSVEWTIGNYWDTNVQAWNTTQTSGTLIVDNFTVTTGTNTIVSVIGDLNVTGSITGTTKSFLIPSPVPSRKDTHFLRHWCVESDCIGGMVLYRKHITATKASTITFEMPDWFKYLVKNVIIFCTPYEHFGSAWGKYTDNNTIEIHTNKGGTYNLLITGARDDDCAKCCPQEVEYKIKEADFVKDELKIHA